MIVCPNCNHQNPEGATQCEACYTPLPATTSCPNCGATVQTDASFCGQCGFNLNVSTSMGGGRTSAPNSLPDLPDLVTPDPLVEPEPMSISSQQPDPDLNATTPPLPDPTFPLPATVVSQPGNTEAGSTTPPTQQQFHHLPLVLPVNRRRHNPLALAFPRYQCQSLLLAAHPDLQLAPRVTLQLSCRYNRLTCSTSKQIPRLSCLLISR
jgi:hypothetical protein